MRNAIQFVVAAALLASLLPVAALAQDWQPVIGAQALRDFVGGRTVSWQEGPSSAWGEYHVDGTGTLHALGTEFDRTWEVKGDDQICFSGEPESQCYTLEKSTADPSLYRVINVTTGETTEIRETGADGASVVSGGPAAASANQSGPATASAGEIASKLLNPANPIMRIGNNFDYVAFDGDLSGASDQSQFKYFFLTVFPFKLSNGNSLMFRPGIPLIFDQGVPNPSGGFDKVGVDMADMGYDLIYSGTTKTGTIWGLGGMGTIPTATDDKLGKKLWGLGPEVLFGKAGKWGAVGGLLGHQWDVAGSGSGDINLTTLNYFYGFTLGNGWALTAAPVISYNYEAASSQALTVPIGIGASKTVVLGGRPWQFVLQYWYNVERPDAFAPVHTLRLGILPIISAPWNKGK